MIKAICYMQMAFLRIKQVFLERRLCMSEKMIERLEAMKRRYLEIDKLMEDEELVKDINKQAENGKVAVRNIRRDAMELCKKMKKNSEMTEDEQKASEKLIQDLTDKYVKNIDEVTARKVKEVMAI